MVLFLCRKRHPTIGLVRLVITMKRSSNKLSRTSNWVQLLRMGFLYVQSPAIFARRVVVIRLKMFVMLLIVFLVGTLLEWRLSVCLSQWGHHWLFPQNPLGHRASSLRVSTGGWSIMVGFLCFCPKLVRVEGWFLCLWPAFDVLWSYLVVKSSVMVNCWLVVD